MPVSYTHLDVYKRQKISTLGSITGQSNTFSKDEIKELEAQPFTRSVGAFTPTLFKALSFTEFDILKNIVRV